MVLSRLAVVLGLVLLAAGCGSTVEADTAEAGGEPAADRESPSDDPADDGDVGDAAAGDEAETADGSVTDVGLLDRSRPEIDIPTEWPSDIEELYGRYWLYWDAYAAAFGPPGADPGHDALRELSSDANWESLQQQLTDFEDDGLMLVLPDRSVTEHLLRLPDTSLLDKSEGSELVIQDCWVDDFMQVTADGRVVAEADEAKLMNVSMKVVDGQWRVNGITRSTADTDGFDECTSYVS